MFICQLYNFVGKDVAEVLEYERPTKAIQDRVDIEDKDEVPIQGDLGGTQTMTIINESGLYSLILSRRDILEIFIKLCFYH